MIVLYIKLYKKQRGGMGANIFSMLCVFAMVAFIYFANDICRVHWSFK